MQGIDLQQYILNSGTTVDISEKLENVLVVIRKHLDMDVAFISEFIDSRRVFKFVDTGSVKGSPGVGDSDPLHETYCKKIADNKLPGIIHNAREHVVTGKLDVTKKLAIGAYMGVPIKLSTGDIYGTFCCYKSSPDETLNQRDLSFLTAIAEIAGNLIEKQINAENFVEAIAERIQSVLDLKQFDVHYQPIYSLHTHRISGFESLSRFYTEPYRAPDVWFSEASQAGLGESLETMAIEQAIQALKVFDSDVYISINTSPEHIVSGAISRALDHVSGDRIVIEITEHSPVEDYSKFRAMLEPLRERGVRLAIDDAGAGYSTFQHILELEADIIKLDMSLIRNIHSIPRKLSLAKALCAFAKAIKCTVIAEGIEAPGELEALKKLGVDSVQGYLIGRPMPLGEAVSYLPSFE